VAVPLDWKICPIISSTVLVKHATSISIMGGLLALLPGTSSDTTQYTLLPSMPSSIRKDLQDEEERRDDTDISDLNADPDAEFGGKEARERLEKKLLRKLDIRMSILIVIYILNYVRACRSIVYLSVQHTLQIDRNNASLVIPMLIL
jgi:hypothetical protein